MHNKIYIMGPVGSGKTTFATKLSKLYNIKYYELDKVCWDDDHGNIRRSDEESQKIFSEILKQKKWIIEDIGREKFKQGRIDADIIYYIKFSKMKAYYSVIKRWIKQKLGFERYNHPPNFNQLIYFISIVKSYFKKEQTKLDDLEKFKAKLKIVSRKDINKILNDTQ